jgi:glycosyltransferase involved in cell wall biosynthesis
MKIVIASGKPHLPQAFGGVPSSTHELALELIGRGHEVSVLCGLSPAGFTGFRIRAALRLSRHPFVRDDGLGYPVYRQWNVRANIAEAVALLKPDAALIQLGELVPLAACFEAVGIPAAIYLHNADVGELHGDPASLRRTSYIANSHFTAGRYRQAFGFESTIIPPLFRAERYIAPRRPDNVTFINPIAHKGRSLAFEIARRCPDIRFRFVKAWALDSEDAESLRREMASVRNVELTAPSRDMRGIYARAKMVLIPSRIEETWGRAATEAQFNGIPVIAANRGGLPEAVGPGGVLLDPDGPAEPWVDAVRRLWNDAAFYESKRQAALDHAGRAEIDPVRQTDALLAVLTRAINSPCENARR